MKHRAKKVKAHKGGKRGLKIHGGFKSVEHKATRKRTRRSKKA